MVTVSNRGKAVYALAAKELQDILRSPTAPLAILFVLLGSGIPFFFPGRIAVFSDFSPANYFSRFPFLAVFFFPALIASCPDSGRKKGAMDLLHTFPHSERTLAAIGLIPVLAVYLIALFFTIPVMLTLPGISQGARIFNGAGVMFSAYFMLFFFGAALTALGQFFSLRFGGRVIPFIVTSASIFVLNTIHLLPSLINLPVPLANICASLSFAWHLEASTRGILDSRDIVFFLIFCLIFLYLSETELRRRRIQK